MVEQNEILNKQVEESEAKTLQLEHKNADLTSQVAKFKKIQKETREKNVKLNSMLEKQRD